MTQSERSYVLVTGAGGKTGQAVLPALRARGLRCMAWVRRPEHVDRALAQGAAEARIVDLTRTEEFAPALRGVACIYHICPNMHPNEKLIAGDLIAAAGRQGVERFVLHSVMYPQIEAMPHHWRKMRAEELLLASGLNFTLIQPSAYLQNLLPYWRSARDLGYFELPFSIDAPISMVDLKDVAAAVAEVVADSEHGYGTYALAGRPQSHREVAKVFSEVLGRSIDARQISVDRWAESARAAGLPLERVDDLVSMFNYYDRHGFVGSPRVLESLLGRPVVGLNTWVRRPAQP